jgi:hypothetical protein
MEPDVSAACRWFLFSTEDSCQATAHGKRGTDQRPESFRDAGHPISPIVPTSAEDAYTVTIPATDKTEAVMLDLIDPLRPCRHRVTVCR